MQKKKRNREFSCLKNECKNKYYNRKVKVTNDYVNSK